MFFKYLISTNIYTKEDAGIMLRFRFPNNYGASVVKHKGSYGYNEGLYEIAILYNNELYYGSLIANDIIGHVNPKDIGKILLQIKGLDNHNEELINIRKK